MRRVGKPRGYDEQIEYHHQDGRAPDFSLGQRGRIELARFLVDKIMRELPKNPFIVELGCGAGDVSGPYSDSPHWAHVTGYDVTAMAESECARRWPNMKFFRQPVEEVEPYNCDLLIMTEFLEHVTDPITIVKRWLPLAGWSIIGHPLNEPDPPIEPGHIWSYDRSDWRLWFSLGGHHWWEEFRFPMAGWDEMIMGHSQRVDDIRARGG